MKPNRAAQNTGRKSSPTQSRNNTENQPGKSTTAQPENPDKAPEPVWVTLIDNDGSIAANVAIPPQLYAALQPFIRAAKAEYPQAFYPGDDIELGFISDPGNESVVSTVQFSQKVSERLWAIEKRDGTKLQKLFRLVFLNGLHLAERDNDLWDALAVAESTAAELCMLQDLTQRYLLAINGEGSLTPNELERVTVGLFRLSDRLSEAMKNSLSAIQKLFPR